MACSVFECDAKITTELIAKNKKRYRNLRFAIEHWSDREKRLAKLETDAYWTILDWSKNWFWPPYPRYSHDVHVNVSGGLDSTVLLHLVRRQLPNVKGVFCDTGLENADNRAFVKTLDNMEWVRPKKTHRQVLEEDGYPVVSKKIARYIWDVRNPTKRNATTRRLRLTGVDSKGKRRSAYMIPKKWRFLLQAPFKISDKCCHYLKKEPLDRYMKEHHSVPFVGMRVDEGDERAKTLFKLWHSNYTGKSPWCAPLLLWTREDILYYILKYNIPYSKAYGEITEGPDGRLYTTGESRTGCDFCAFGVQFEKGENRFIRMERENPSRYKYCMDVLGYRRVLQYMGIPFSRSQVTIAEQLALPFDDIDCVAAGKPALSVLTGGNQNPDHSAKNMVAASR
ncbi:phosphoadenosine phosphosulfate reductase family protein [Heliobacterium undosum]|uniref:Phosphoadenosine phosphosulfate reductase family protein n=1 Tax=Heliomicrobium undosum TaxID=121734 RepID=A0A845L7Y8_9FIRM|nr:phosphoadenosine phosphosulfate reductase family protein [Heliomicrobium undosum]MZP31409.1 phosphoadenosine phosphosulfate reductase family protein [Heliomicrobium undosum]